MLWFALHLPSLPLDALPAAGAPVGRCIVEQRRVLAASRAARAAGVEPGQSATTAAALAPGVQQLPRDPQRETQFVQLLAVALARYTPRIVVQDDGVLLEVLSSLRLFGGVRSLARQVRQTACECGAHARLAIAPAPAAAALFARVPAVVRPPADPPRGRRPIPPPPVRRRPGRALRLPRMRRLLDALPVPQVLQALQQPPFVADLLHAVGCRRVADVLALPRAGLQKRGCAELLAVLDRAAGDAPDPQQWFDPPQRFAMTLELTHCAEDAGQLVFAAQRLVQALAGWLAGQWLAASRLRLRLRHEHGRRQAAAAVHDDVTIELGLPSRDAARIMTLLRERLQRHALAAPVYSIELQLDEAVSHAGSAGTLLPDAGQQAQALQALLDRIGSRLGFDRVLRIAVADDHRPERAQRVEPAFNAASPQRAVPHAGEPAPQDAIRRPVWLLPEPLRLAERNGMPVHGSALALLTGAERIEAGWFDGQLVCRDYHCAVGEDHRLRWIYRERGAGEAAWYLHGLFA